MLKKLTVFKLGVSGCLDLDFFEHVFPIFHLIHNEFKTVFVRGSLMKNYSDSDLKKLVSIMYEK